MKFNFEQKSTKETLKGNCLMVFPKKLKCIYDDKNQQEIIISNKRLSITQKRYNKSYFYPLSNSPFINILDKEGLINLVNDGQIINEEEYIVIKSSSEIEADLFFEKSSYVLKGWKIKDQFDNDIIFLIDEVKLNDDIAASTFRHPEIN